MSEPRITVEGGQFDWNSGRGYEAQADGTEEGDGFNPPSRPRPDPPPFVSPPDTGPVLPPETKAMPEQQSGSGMEGVGAIEALLEYLNPSYLQSVGEPMPTERVNIDRGTAVFRGHSIELSPDGLEAIRTVLAMEVCRALDEEKARVLHGMQFAGMQTGSDAGGTDVPEVPKSAAEVVEEPEVAAGPVQ